LIIDWFFILIFDLFVFVPDMKNLTIRFPRPRGLYERTEKAARLKF